MTEHPRAGRVRLTVSVPVAIAEQLRREAQEHDRSVACEGGQLIRLGLEARAEMAGRRADAAADNSTLEARRVAAGPASR
jgi:hypothetical protein